MSARGAIPPCSADWFISATRTLAPGDLLHPRRDVPYRLPVARIGPRAHALPICGLFDGAWTGTPQFSLLTMHDGAVATRWHLDSWSNPLPVAAADSASHKAALADRAAPIVTAFVTQETPGSRLPGTVQCDAARPLRRHGSCSQSAGPLTNFSEGAAVHLLARHLFFNSARAGPTTELAINGSFVGQTFKCRVSQSGFRPIVATAIRATLITQVDSYIVTPTLPKTSQYAQPLSLQADLAYILGFVYLLCTNLGYNENDFDTGSSSDVDPGPTFGETWYGSY